MKKIICLTIALIITALAVTGCNTLEGFGKDIENTGQAIQGVND